MFGISLPLALTALAALAGLGICAHALWLRGRARGRLRCPGSPWRLLPFVRKSCWYQLPDLQEGSYQACPECGAYVASREEMLRTRRFWGEAMVGVAVFGAAVGLPAYRLASAAKWWEVAPMTMTIAWLEFNQTHANVDSEVFAYACDKAGGGDAWGWQEDLLARRLADEILLDDTRVSSRALSRAYLNFPANQIVHAAAIERLSGLDPDANTVLAGQLVQLIGHAKQDPHEAVSLIRRKNELCQPEMYLFALTILDPTEAKPELVRFASTLHGQELDDPVDGHRLRHLQFYSVWALGLCEQSVESNALGVLAALNGDEWEILPLVAEISSRGLKGENLPTVLAETALSDGPEELREWACYVLMHLGPLATSASDQVPGLLESDLRVAREAAVRILWYDRRAAKRHRDELRYYVQNTPLELGLPQAKRLLDVMD